MTSAIEQDAAVKVIGSAANGALALAGIEQLRPDVVTCDIEMPVMNGVTTVREIRRRYRDLPVIMFSTLTEQGARATLEALSAGANDYVTKPSNTGAVVASMNAVREQLVPRIKALHEARQAAGRRPAARPAVSTTAGAPAVSTTAEASAPPVAPTPSPDGSATAAAPPAPTAPDPTAPDPTAPDRSALNRRAPRRAVPAPSRPAARTAPRPVPAGPAPAGAAVPLWLPAVRRPSVGRIDVVAVGCSTGGPDALARVLAVLPASLPVPVVVVQHMPPLFTRLFAERLDRGSPLTVVEATNGQPLLPGHVYVAPGDHHLEVVRSGNGVVTRLHDDPPENFCRPAADVMFRSVAAAFGAAALGLVLAGMGSDGRRGAEVMVAKGARFIAQDAETSVVWGMPGALVQAGLADEVLALSAVATAVSDRTLVGRRPAASTAAQRSTGTTRKVG